MFVSRLDVDSDEEHVYRGEGLSGSGRENNLGFGGERGNGQFRPGLVRAHGSLAGVSGKTENRPGDTG